jgi:spermidine synthase
LKWGEKGLQYAKYLSATERFGLYAVIVWTGACVMMLEILGTRVLAPFYGTSLIVWAALISVTLVALALGYFLGGFLAERADLSLSQVLALAGVACAAVPSLAKQVLMLSEPLGLHLGALVSASLLFALPLTLLAMVGPWIIQLCCVSANAAGLTSGTVYAISTLGSVAGTLALSFYLLPTFGSRLLLSSLGMSLIGLAVFVSRWEAKRCQQRWRPVWVFVAGLCALGFWYVAEAKASNARFQGESLYGKVQVVDDPKFNARWLLVDASIIGGIDLITGESRLAYQELVVKALSVSPAAQNVLLIGLGAGTLVPKFERLGLKVDVIELDPRVAEAAQTWFNFRLAGKLWIADARTKVREIPHRYDLIVHDCFTGGSEPTHLLTLEAFKDLRARLAPQGVLVLNFVGFQSGPGRKALEWVFRTLQTVFPKVVLLADEPRENFTDFVFLAASFPFALPAILEPYRIGFSPPPGPVLHDAHNPLEFFQQEKAKTYRTLLFEQVGRDLFL